VVSRDLQHAVDASGIVATMQAALDSWGNVQSDLDTLYRSLNLGEVAGSFELAVEQLMAPLPRAWQWLDGSCFLSHGELMQKAFNLEPIENIERIPLIYQGAGATFLARAQKYPCPARLMASISKASSLYC